MEKINDASCENAIFALLHFQRLAVIDIARLIFNDLQSSKMAATPCAANSQLKLQQHARRILQRFPCDTDDFVVAVFHTTQVDILNRIVGM